MEITSISDFRRAVRDGAYAWPGGYPKFWIMSDGGACAFSVAKSERRAMLEAIAAKDNSGWRPIAIAINWENGALYCDHTGERIESAYAEPEDEPAPLE